MSVLCLIPLVAGLFAHCLPPAPLAVGYVEGETVLIAPVETAELARLAVRKGDRVAAGQVLAGLQARDAEIAVADAEARLGQATAERANLLHGRRPEEIAVIEAALASAEAQARAAERSVERSRRLIGGGYVSATTVEEAETALELARARVAESQANLAVARLPARAEEIAAADNRLASAAADLAQARWRLAQRSLTAPAGGEVVDVIRRVGEIAGPAAPVLSLLPDGAVKLKLYVPEPAFARLALGSVLRVRCDGCPPGLEARVSHLAREPEFTPPVIYSLETRQKLVYLVEAVPVAAAAALRPGQLVDVVLAGPAP